MNDEKRTFLDSPRMGWVVSLCVALLTLALVTSQRLSALEKSSDERAARDALVITQRNRETDDIKTRLSSLERYCYGHSSQNGP